MSRSYPFNVRDLAHLLEESFAYKDEPVEFIRNRYEKYAKNFDEALEFLVALKLVRQKDNSVIVSRRLRKIEHPTTLEQVIKDALIRSHTFTDVHQLILKFQPEGIGFVYSPSRSERFAESHIRNLLISLGIVRYERDADVYILDSHDYEVVFSLAGSSHKKLSLKALHAIQTRNEKIGGMAEEIVLGFEKERLIDHPDLANRIAYTAELDVTAGYDIESFEASTDITKRFIEVKAVSPYDFGFEWSIGEVRAAKYLQKQYFLYLLPVINGIPSIKDAVVIQNPAEKLADRKKWDMRVSGYSVSLNSSKIAMYLDLA
ncbi:MAG: hypothetical protein JWS12_600 [Candidatus Saccharibacteria bacterium]|nr:hypothetical protein [Candidatus Saccharibacteria bacterium]